MKVPWQVVSVVAIMATHLVLAVVVRAIFWGRWPSLRDLIWLDTPWMLLVLLLPTLALSERTLRLIQARFAPDDQASGTTPPSNDDRRSGR